MFPLTDQEKLETGNTLEDLLDTLKESNEHIKKLKELLSSRAMLLDEEILKEIRSTTCDIDATVFDIGVCQYKNRQHKERTFVRESRDSEPDW